MSSTTNLSIFNQTFKKSVIGVVIVFAVLFFLSVVFTWLSLQKLQNYQLKPAQQLSKLARISLTPWQYLTLRQSHALEAWSSGLSIISLLPTLSQEIETSWQSLSQTTYLATSEDNKFLTDQLSTKIIQASHYLEDFNSHVNKSRLLQFFISEQQLTELNKLTQLAQSLQVIIEHFSQGQHNVVVLLHNSDEIRATGGFVGSVVSLSLNQGMMSEPIFYDVYDLATQTVLQKPAPVGVKLFLSGGKDGLALTDANWEPDFSQSAQDILDLLDQTILPRTDLLVAVNLDLMRDILEVTGLVVLPDYPHDKQTVTAENLSQLARQDRYDFFAGDKQKKLFLQDLYTVLKIKLTQLDQGQFLQLVKTFINSAQTKQYFFYSTQPYIQELFIIHDIAGVINPVTDFFLYPVESNVGINKANQKIDREVDLKISSNLITFLIKFQNNNQPLSAEEVSLIHNNPDLQQADHLGYVNYFRLLTNARFSQVTVKCNNLSTELLEKDLVPTWQGQAHQFGFLLTVPEQASTNCEISLVSSQPLSPSHSWSILKQPGLPETEYNITFFGQRSQKKLNKKIIL